MEDQILEVEKEVVVETPEAPAPVQAEPEKVEAPEPGNEADKPAAELSDNIGNAWTPNFKVKAYDSEYEIPDAFRSLIKDEASEKQVRDVFEKAYATEVLRGKYTKNQERLKTIETEYGSTKKDFDVYKKSISTLSTYVRNKDFDTYFAALQIPENEIKAWLYKKMSAEQDPAQRQAYESELQLKQRLYSEQEAREKLEQENQEFKSSQQQGLVDQRTQELTAALSRPEVAAIQQAFDQREGKENAFIEAVIERAAYLYEKKGIDLSAEQAVQEVVKMLTFSQPTASRPASTVIVQKEKAPTLPNIRGQGTTPIAKTIGSIDDLKKRRNQVLMEASDALKNQ